MKPSDRPQVRSWLRARIGTLFLAGPMPKAAELQDRFDLSRCAAYEWLRKLRVARREFSA
jgi:hypothetical protein